MPAELSYRILPNDTINIEGTYRNCFAPTSKSRLSLCLIKKHTKRL